MLFTPLTLRCGLVLPNRIALAPMTNLQSQPDGLLGEDELTWLAARADGGFGTVITCAAYVAQDGKAWPGELGVDRDECLPGLRRLADRMHQAGAVAMAQLFHGGVRADQKVSGIQPWSASTWHEDAADFVDPRAATLADIQRVITEFADAAARCEKAGFDGVELHGAHGYLLCQFMSRTMNPAGGVPGYSGDSEGRARLVREVVRACRAKVSPRFAIGVRFSFEDFGNAKGMDLDDNLQIAKWVVDDGADFVHASLWDLARNSFKYPDQHVLPLVRSALPRDIVIFTAGKIWTAADAEGALAKGADVVALGRSGIVNPDWPHVVAQGRAPQLAPVQESELLQRAVSPMFAVYLRRWKNFIATSIVLALVLVACGGNKTPPCMDCGAPMNPPAPRFVAERQQLCEQARSLAEQQCPMFGKEDSSLSDCSIVSKFYIASIESCLASPDCGAFVDCVSQTMNTDKPFAGPTTSCNVLDDRNVPAGFSGTDLERSTGRNDKTFADTVSTRAIPIEVCGTLAELAYLQRLTCADGSRPVAERNQALAAHNGDPVVGGRCQREVQEYAVTCPEKAYAVFVDHFRCPQARFE